MKNQKKAVSTISTFAKIALVATMAVQLIPSASAQDNWEGNIRLLAGKKSLDDGDWGSMDRQDQFGVMFDLKRTEWPVSIALDIIASGADSDSSDLENERGGTVEQHLGVRKTWHTQGSAIHRYVGGGIAFIDGGFEEREPLGGEKFDDSGIGGWVGAGAYWDITEQVNLGFDVRYSKAKIDVRDAEIKAGGIHTGLTLGYSF